MQNLAQNPFGIIKAPETAFTGKEPGEAIGSLIQLVLWILIIGAGVYALFNLVLAGYSFMSAGDDPKKVTGAWAKIWQTVLGLAVAAGAFVLAGIFGQLIFGRWDFILNPSIDPIQ
ncbi:MAG: hypothetical protein UX13_C0016G0017 [Candidatus Woesebacteria bacterium GW2011_GWB1_45_5]|uniref:Integral membrane protein n=1 Tax=Candidatus Woesebacteria bacterium GW2011_GWB1_45_5 TaxID=1618581 RepID=A0A0G1QNP6_9BACT|nr:MAG: hypothetical protein UX13_C0016G0017 [Candidatus Woesebacteria bacterium GW2011_GWB1_45_5]